MAKKKLITKYKSNILAQWYTKQFYVSKSEMNTFMNFSASHSYAYDEIENDKKVPNIDKKHVDNSSVSFEIPIRVEWCKDVRIEYEWWRDQCDKGRESLLYIGAKVFGKKNYLLESVDLKNVKLSNKGVWISCILSVKFIESPNSKKPSKKTKKKIGMGAKTRTTAIYKKAKEEYITKKYK